MKRLLVLVLLVPILALTMISCDADMRSNLAGFMGGFNSNVYADAGLIVANTAQAEAAAATIAAIGTGAGGSENFTGGNSTSLGIAVTVPAGATSMLAPQSPDKQKELKDNLGDAFNSTTQKAKLLEDLKAPVTDAGQKTAAQGTVLVLNQALDDLKTSLSGSSDLGDALEKLKLPAIADGDTITQGDLLALQLMTDLISNTINTLNAIGGGTSGDNGAGLGNVDGDALELSANQDAVLEIISDALSTADLAKKISGSTTVDFSGQIDLGSLLDSVVGKGTYSRTIYNDEIYGVVQLATGLINLHYCGQSYLYSDLG